VKQWRSLDSWPATREAYALDLRQFAIWCANHERRLFEVHRVDIECFGRELEARGRARATIARRLCTIAGFYRYAEEEGLMAHSPAIHVRRPRLDYESHATGLDRNELGALLVAAGLSSARDHALVSLLALNGLRVSEALHADIDALGLERGHRTLTVTRKGSKVVTMPLAPRVAGPSTSRSAIVSRARSSWTARVNDSTVMPPGGLSAASPDKAGSASASGLTPCGMPSLLLRWTPAFRCVTSKKQPAMPTRAPRCATTEDASLSTVTPPTSLPRSSLAPRVYADRSGVRAPRPVGARAPDRAICVLACEAAARSSWTSKPRTCGHCARPDALARGLLRSFPRTRNGTKLL
jgi:integrase